MKLTIEQLSKLTKLSVPTLRVYVTRKKLGTKVGKNRVFSQADVQKLLKPSRDSSGKAKGKTKSVKVKTGKRTVNTKQSQKTSVKPIVVQAKVEASNVKSERRGFFSSLFGTRKPKGKDNLLDVKKGK